MGANIMNPVLTGFNPDPSIARSGEDFYLTTSSFEYFPGLPIYHSRDLVNWKLIGHTLTRQSQLNMRTVEPGAGIWAPTLRWRRDRGGAKGRFYLATCKWDRYRPQTDERIFPRGFYVYTDNIWDEGVWSDPIYFDNPGFDQDLFWDDDGKVYLSTTTRIANRPKDSIKKDFAIHISEINLSSGTSLTAPMIIRSSPYGIAEGSHIIKRGRFYYLFTAEGGTESGHQEWVCRSELGPLGPWELGPRNPLWYNGSNEAVQNTGHADVFEDSKGHWWAVLLGVRPRRLNGTWQESPLGRETFLVRVHWIDDWPQFNHGENISLETRFGDELDDTTPVQNLSKLCWRADLSRRDLELGWYQKNTPLKPNFTLGFPRNFIRLFGGCYPLSSPEAPTMLLRKQTALSQRFGAGLNFQPSKSGYEAGIVVWWSMHSYATVGVRRSAEGGGLEAVFRSPGDEVTLFLQPAWCSKYELDITSSEEVYELSLNAPQTFFPSYTIPVSKLIVSPPIGGSFTGMMFGLYAFGNGEPCLDPADFDSIVHESL